MKIETVTEEEAEQGSADQTLTSTPADDDVPEAPPAAEQLSSSEAPAAQ
jgi:hypothetical protein